MLSIEESKTGFAAAAINDLGFSSRECPTLRCFGQFEVGLSVHAPSYAAINLQKPAEVFGFINASGSIDRQNPIEFWCDYNYIGEVSDPGNTTKTFNLSPGRHVLQTLCNNMPGRHSAWGFTSAAKQPDSDMAFVTVGAYQEEEVVKNLKIFAYSAAKQGIWTTVFGTGQSHQSHYYSKVWQLRRWINDLPLHVRYVVFADAGDSMWLAKPEEFRQKFLDLKVPIVMGVERNCAPVEHDKAFALAFPPQKHGRNWICTGTWMGEKKALVDALDVLESLAEQIRRGNSEEFGNFWKWRYFASNDQFLWHIAYLLGKVQLHLDADFRICANVFKQPTDFNSTAFVAKDGRMIDTISNESPCMVHFNGGWSGYHQWAALLKCI